MPASQVIKFNGTRAVNEIQYSGRNKFWAPGQTESVSVDVANSLISVRTPFGTWEPGVIDPTNPFQYSNAVPSSDCVLSVKASQVSYGTLVDQGPNQNVFTANAGLFPVSWAPSS